MGVEEMCMLSINRVSEKIKPNCRTKSPRMCPSNRLSLAILRTSKSKTPNPLKQSLPSVSPKIARHAWPSLFCTQSQRSFFTLTAI